MRRCAMQEIICPGCGKAFKIDEAGYADILKQVRGREFEQALHERLELVEREKQMAVELAEAKIARALEKDAAVKTAEIERLKEELKSRDVAKQLAVNEAVSALEKERDSLARDFGATESEQKVLQARLDEARKEEGGSGRTCRGDSYEQAPGRGRGKGCRDRAPKRRAQVARHRQTARRE